MTHRFLPIVAVTLACLVPNAQAQPSQPSADQVPNFVVPSTAGTKAILEFRAAQKEAVPACRGYRAPILTDNWREWSTELTPDRLPDLTTKMQLAGDIVARSLAREGLVVTLARVVECVGYRWVSKRGQQTPDDLAAIGFPADLLGFFPNENEEYSEPYRVVVDVTRSLGSDPQIDEVMPMLLARKLQFRPTAPGFRLAPDSGQLAPGLIRMQMPTDSYYQGPGDGGSLDVLHQLLEQFPDIPFVVSINAQHLQLFTKHVDSWRLPRMDRLTILSEPSPVSQWAQDNGRAGFMPSKNGAAAKPLILAPRYASRREEVSSFIPGENWLLDSVAAAGVEIIRSPLLFQGGNLLMVEEASGRRVLLIGEAEVWRNVALGLTREQTLEAFRLEFGADACVVLPNVSYHIDYEVSVRTVGGKTIAFVNDTTKATTHILSATLSSMEKAGAITQSDADAARLKLQANSTEAALALIESVLEKHSVGYGRFPVSFANVFARGNVDSGVGNLQRILLALDTAAFTPEPPTWRAPDAAGETYARSLRRREADRAALRKTLAAQGWTVVPIPSTADGERSVNYLNGLHLKDRYLMPVQGGFMSELDESAKKAFSMALGPETRVVPIRTAESQRRDGAVRCSVCVLPRN
ncbi:MAG: hypothetical protein HZA51_00095 [Planctomycetes bacterium]|nr:hypothetical protein [Planctomycetota bacterium]